MCGIIISSIDIHNKKDDKCISLNKNFHLIKDNSIINMNITLIFGFARHIQIQTAIYRDRQTQTYSHVSKIIKIPLMDITSSNRNVEYSNLAEIEFLTRSNGSVFTGM